MDISILPKFFADKKLVRRFDLLMLEWKRAYPDVNLDNQIQWAHAWLISSGKKYTDMGRFLNNWLKNEQKKIALNKPTATKPILYKEQIPAEEELLTYEDIVKSKTKAS